MNIHQLFHVLDLDRDGRLSREDLRDAAQRLGWHWPQAPIYAVLDFLTVLSPLGERDFVSCMEQISRDPLGPYGQVLRRGPRVSAPVRPGDPGKKCDSRPETRNGEIGLPGWGAGLESDHAPSAAELLEDIEGHEVAADYRAVLDRLAAARPALRPEEAALLLIDPQRSFGSGAWMRSIGENADHEVMPIRLAFRNCAALLRSLHRRAEVMFTRCPFPPASYDWDEGLAGIVSPTQPYFVKPGNSVMWPPTNGYREWLGDLRRRGRKVLVMGGCTLNSCLRVSSIETLQYPRAGNLEVLVDLSLCGARTANYVGSSLFGGMSSVESAIREMASSGVGIAGRVAWR